MVRLVVEVKIEPGWKEVLEGEFEKDYFALLSQFVRDEYANKTIYPPPGFIFRAFWLTPFDQVKVVIIGQDPYHGPKQANGLCFAVNKGVALPPSVQNIYKEIESDLGHKSKFPEGDLAEWAKQGVLLLNATLTVEANKAGSHQNKGWESFTDTIIQTLSEQKDKLVFVLWGNYAKKKGIIIDRKKHLVIESPHPSPFAARTGFFGSKPFSKTNEYLIKHGAIPIDW